MIDGVGAIHLTGRVSINGTGPAEYWDDNTLCGGDGSKSQGGLLV